LRMPKYHVYVEYAGDLEKSTIRFNLHEEELVRTFINPYTGGKPFLFCGKLLNPAKVDKVIIFWSYEDGGTLVLPNREMVAGHPNKKFAMERICAGKVKGVAVCTERFLSSKRETTSPQ
jgi:hypothetical protein